MPPVGVPAAHHPEEVADTFGGIAAPQDAIAAIESDDPAKAAIVEATVRAIYAPVIDVHWVTIKQLAQLEPTLVETVACMIGALLKEALDEAVNTMGVPEAAAAASCSATPRSRSPTACAATTRSPTPASSPWTTAGSRSSRRTGRRSSRTTSSTRTSPVMLHLDKIELGRWARGRQAAQSPPATFPGGSCIRLSSRSAPSA